METKGRKAGAMQVDRQNHKLGYSRDNICILECSLNSSKGTWEKKNKGEHPELDEDIPF